MQGYDPSVVSLTLRDLLEDDVAEYDVGCMDVAGYAFQESPELSPDLDEPSRSLLIFKGCLGGCLDLVERLPEKGEEMKKRDRHEYQLGGVHENLGHCRGRATIPILRSEKVAVIILLLLHEFLQIKKSLAMW